LSFMFVLEKKTDIPRQIYIIFVLEKSSKDNMLKLASLESTYV
jgi:hypothetical protein